MRQVMEPLETDQTTISFRNKTKFTLSRKTLKPLLLSISESESNICHIHKESQHNRQNRHRILESIRSSVAHCIMKTSALIGFTI